jgi:hypothetical protein
MEKIIEVNGNWLFSNEHFLLTERGLLKAKELQIDDKVITAKDESTSIKFINQQEIVINGEMY